MLRWRAHWAGLAALAVAVIVAVAVYGMPIGLAGLSATQGAVFGLFPIMWIVFGAIVLYQITVVSGRFEDLRASFHLISDDPRVQAIIIAFCFGGLLEALAGFGAPVAITGVMLMALGFAPLRAAAVVLLANTAPVAFGAVGTPIITAGRLTGIPYQEIGAYVGHQTPIIAFIVPLLLVFLVAAIWYLSLDRGVGVMFLFFLALVVVMNFLLTRTRWGRSVYAVGGSVEAARRAGIRVDRIYLSVFALCSTKEGFGLAAMEALAAGVPVVLRDLPVLRDVFGPAALFGADPRGLAADPELQQHHVGVRDALDHVARVADHAGVPGAGEHAAGDAAHEGEALGIGVHEPQLVDRQERAQPREPVDELGGVGGAPSDDRDLHPYPFTPENLMPSMNCFCARKNSTMTGSMTSTVAAIVRFHCT